VTAIMLHLVASRNNRQVAV